MEGWYIEIATGRVISVRDHAKDIGSIGLAPQTLDKDRIRRLALQKGFARVRQHGSSVVIDFDHDLKQTLDAVLPFLTNNFGPNMWVAMQDVGKNRLYNEFTVGDLDDPERVDQIFGLVFERKIRLSRLYDGTAKAPYSKNNRLQW